MISNIKFQHKDLLLYLGNQVQYLDAKKDRWIPLKQVYKDYKQFMEKQDQQPLLYRQFRQDFQEILEVLPKKATQISKKKNIWVISNIALTNKSEMVAIYQNFYNL